MKYIVVLLSVCMVHSLVAQTQDTNFSKRLTTFTWMPDGNSLLLNIVRVEKNGKSRPTAKKFLYNIRKQEWTPFTLRESGLSVSPDGKSVAYIKRKEDGMTAIYLHQFIGGQDEILTEDTTRKFGISWSANGHKIAYNSEFKKDDKTAIEIYVYDMAAKKLKQITNSFPYYSYNPVWNPVSEQIVYFLEKGDGHDQIYLTDSNGSFQTNLTNDSGSHNYSPSWINKKKILYTRSPNQIVVSDIRGKVLSTTEGTRNMLAKFNIASGMIAYMDQEEGKLYLYNYRKKTRRLLIDQATLNTIAFE